MERRHTRRLVRYWVFLSIAYVFALVSYLYYSAIHATLSSVSASVGMIGPRYLMSVIGLYYLMGFVLGIVFLGFDLRARDVRENIVEVLDARPLTNFELVAGRFLALFLSAWIPVVVLVLLIQGLGVLLPLLSSPVGRTVEPSSLVFFAVFMAVPALAFAIGFVFVVTLLVRHRLVAAALTVGALVGLVVVVFTSPATSTPYLDFMGFAQGVLPSDVVPGLFLPGGWQQRVGVLLLGLGLVGIAAAIHPRLDGVRRSRPLAGAAALCVAGALALVLVGQMRRSDVDLLAQWRSAHEARVGETVVDVVAIDGTVGIVPGESLAADLEVEIEAPADAALRTALFTLNPGLAVTDVAAAGGRALEFEHADGLLAIALPAALAPGARTTLRVRYAGRPDTRFGYLDSTLELESMDVNQAQVSLLGTDVGIFDRRYAALTPGLRWLPASGADVGRDDPRTRRPDFFRAALDVEVPAEWLVAGPGKRAEIGAAAGRKTFRFAPAVELPEIALMAGALESYAMEIDGVTFEALVHPKHAQNFTVLAEARGEVEQWIADRLEAARAAGLPYPFDAFTAVEVPNSLRSYEGGWRLDTALAPPAMALMREPSFPTARFDFDVVALLPGGRNLEQEGGKPRIDRDRLVTFFVNDLSGGNVFAAAARSFFTHRTAARGRDALALDYMLEELSTLLVSGRRSYFSAHLFTNLNQALVSVMNNLQGLNAISDTMIRNRTLQTEVWDSMLDAPLSDLDPRADPQRAIDTLTLKAGQLAQVLRDTLGDVAVGELLRRLLERHAGGSFTLEEFLAVSRGVSPEVEPLVVDWLASTGLPGFVVRGVEQYRLPPDEIGDNRYQLLVRLSNDEPVVGFARVEWTVLSPAGGTTVLGAAAGRGGPGTALQTAATSVSDPIRIDGESAVEFGVVLRRPAATVRILPYLSLNRAEWVAGNLAQSREPPIRDVEPLEGVRAAVLDPRGDERIMVDDLDEAFTIVDEAGEGDMRLAGRNEPVAGLDHGLPTAAAVLPNVWSRRGNGTAWGRYRHTFAYVGAGDGKTRAVMPVSIPRAGRWELEIHLPQYNNIDRGIWNLEIVSADGREPVTYNAAIGNVGWNVVGEFDVPAGEVSVELRDDTTGRLVVADAIAWSPARTRAAAAANNDNRK